MAKAVKAAAKSNPTISKPGTNKNDALIAIAAILGGVYAGVVALFVLFANSQTGLLVPIAVAFAVLGGLLGYFATKA